MWQNNENQRGNCPPTFQQLLIGNAGNANQQSTAGTQTANVVSGTGRWSSNVPLSSIATAAMVLPQQTGFPNLTPAFAPISSTVRLPMSIDQRNRAFEFGEASTSSRPKKASKQPGSSFSQQIPSLMGDFNIEFDALLNNFIKTISDSVQLSQMRYLKSMVAYFEQRAARRIQEKEAEVQNVNWKNSVLEERILKLCFDNNNLENRAIQNAIYVSQLKATLNQVEARFLINAAAAPVPAGLLPAPAIEGIGDTDGTPFPANDEQSCFKIEDVTAESNEKVYGKMTCRVCRKNEISVVVLHCHHLCLCMECETKVDRCPICNSSKDASIQVIMP